MKSRYIRVGAWRADVLQNKRNCRHFVNLERGRRMVAYFEGRCAYSKGR